MALFGKKKAAAETKDTQKEVAKKAPVANLARPSDRDLKAVLVRPHITEKSVTAGERNVYTFEVRLDATKIDVRDAVKEIFGVTPVKVNIVNKAPRRTMSRARGREVKVAGMKKAYVYLKAGDTITLV